MNDTTGQSDQIMHAARQSLSVQQNGGTHRLDPPKWAGTAAARRKTWFNRAKYFAAAVLAIFVSASVAGLVLSNGIGFAGIMMTALAVMVAAFVFANYPKVKVPKRADLGQGKLDEMVTRTELWLEAQRSALPPAAIAIVDQLGAQLDALSDQLARMDHTHPAMDEVRELVGEYIPETIDNYRKIPEHLREEEYAGKTANARLVESLGKLSAEVERVTRRLAEGALDDLAVKSRYLDYRYGGDDLIGDMRGDDQGAGVPLPDFDAVSNPIKAPR